jgi:hypothetical protein
LRDAALDSSVPVFAPACRLRKILSRRRDTPLLLQSLTIVLRFP